MNYKCPKSSPPSPQLQCCLCIQARHCDRSCGCHFAFGQTAVSAKQNISEKALGTLQATTHSIVVGGGGGIHKSLENVPIAVFLKYFAHDCLKIRKTNEKGCTLKARNALIFQTILVIISHHIYKINS